MKFLLQSLVLESAARTPERTALRLLDATLSYSELEQRSNQVAHVLYDFGVRRGDRVGIYSPKSLEAVISLYGILKAGAAYVPLDPLAPAERVAMIIRDCGLRGLCTSAVMSEHLPAVVARAAGLAWTLGISTAVRPELSTADWQVVAQAPAHPLAQTLTEQDLAYILYTSGSTGTPKGVVHTHRSALAFVEWAVAEFGLHGDDVLSGHAPLHFDLSTFDLFAAATVGATTLLLPESIKRLPASLAELIARMRVTTWYSVPTALIQLLLRGALAAYDLSALRRVLFAGEVLPTKFLRALMQRLPGARFSNLYGPTETNVCTFYHVPPLAEEADEPIPIGRPCANTELLVLDESGAAVRPGESGELVVRGPLVMRGYWQRPELNERAFFIRDSAAPTPDVYYRTGDLVVEELAGGYRLLGRRDNQVKTRGYRVDLEEVEQALLGCAAVEQAAAYALPDEEGSCLIAAAVVFCAGHTSSLPELRALLAATLPPYALPTQLAAVSELPRTSTGKIDRPTLRARALSARNHPHG